eukprot:COSAG02_NODE_1901_length_10451_cov_44.668566_1_plen_48_part_00
MRIGIQTYEMERYSGTSYKFTVPELLVSIVFIRIVLLRLYSTSPIAS